MSSSDDPFADRETIKQSVTVTRDFAERLATQYSGSLSLSEAIRDAAEDALSYREKGVTPEDITQSTRRALEKSTPIAVDSGTTKNRSDRD